MVGFFWFIEVKEVIEAAEASEVTWLLGSIRLLTIEIFRVITLIYFSIVWHII